jgi:KipI family sensor histidine kinase inhibitor
MTLKPPIILPYGDSALLVQYETEGFSQKINDAVHHLAADLRAQPQWTELVPAYDSLLCVFNLAELSLEAAEQHVKQALSLKKPPAISAGKTIDIPIVYGGTYGPDMGAIKKSSGLSKAEIIALHCAAPYRVCMMGFIPGFCFLSEAPAALHHPRRASPRAKIPAGSVGIAGWQTGIYGLESPGGWQIIGRTPLKIFDKNRAKPFLIEAGDTVRFVPSKPEIFK